MAETVRNLFLKARALLDEYSDDGVLIPESEVIDMMGKSILLADMAQKELHKIGKLYNTFEFANKPAPNPVSYTHLRAHETRHDLVCRLLLEKKKKQKT